MSKRAAELFKKSRSAQLIEKAVALLFPSTCPVCAQPSDRYGSSPLCSSCWRTITPMKGNRCPVCALPLAGENTLRCVSCISREPAFCATYAYGLYDGALKEAIHSFKFQGAARLARPLGEFLCGLDIPEADYILPVPLTKKRLLERGYNQCLLLARRLSQGLAIPLKANLLQKKEETPVQATLKRTKRLTALEGAFRVTGSVEGARLILVDDVMTTGSTLRECARTLRDAGAGEIRVAVLARTVR